MEEWNSACLSSCSWGDSPLVELCVESAVFSGRGTWLSVPLRFVPSNTGLPWKRCLCIGFLSRADREIGVFWNVAPHTRLRLAFHHETGLILRCAGKAWDPIQTKQLNRPSCFDQEGRRGPHEVVPRTQCSPRVRLVCRGTFGVAPRVPNTVLNFKTERGTSLETL